jgi:hypothetical protein
LTVSTRFGIEVVAQLELDVDVGERLADPLPHGTSWL